MFHCQWVKTPCLNSQKTLYVYVMPFTLSVAGLALHISQTKKAKFSHVFFIQLEPRHSNATAQTTAANAKAPT